MADIVWTESYWLERVRDLAILRDFWDNDAESVYLAMPAGYLPLAYVHRHEAWLPSYVIGADATGRNVRVWVQGTTNTTQIASHIFGIIATKDHDALAHSGFLEAGTRLGAEIKAHLPAPADLVSLTICGHSYGSATAQVAGIWLADQGYDPSRIKVIAMASPKVYAGVPQLPAIGIDLISRVQDPVPYVPSNFMPVFVYDVNDGFFPTPAIFSEWRFIGNENWLLLSGGVQDDFFSSDFTAGPHQPFQGSDNHSYAAYVDSMVRMATLQSWSLDGFPRALLNKAVQPLATNPPGHQIPDNTFDQGITPELPAWLLWQTSTGIKGGASMAWKCQADYECGGYGWSETYYFLPTEGGSQDTISGAYNAFAGLLKQRLKIDYPAVVAGLTYKLLHLRVSKEGVRRKSYSESDPSALYPAKPGDGKATGNAEPAFYTVRYRADAGEHASRSILIRPVRDTSVIDSDGAVFPLAGLATIGASFVAYLKTTGWAIKHQNRIANLPKPVVAIATAPLAEGLADLVVTAHGFSSTDLPMKVAVEGGDTEWASYRGIKRVLSVPTPDTLRVQFGQPVTGLEPGATVRRITYTYSLITSVVVDQVRGRQTGRPYARGRGRRRSRAH